MHHRCLTRSIKQTCLPLVAIGAVVFGEFILLSYLVIVGLSCELFFSWCLAPLVSQSCLRCKQHPPHTRCLGLTLPCKALLQWSTFTHWPPLLSAIMPCPPATTISYQIPHGITEQLLRYYPNECVSAIGQMSWAFGCLGVFCLMDVPVGPLTFPVGGLGNFQWERFVC